MWWTIFQKFRKMEKREECLRLYDANKSKSFPEVEDISCDDLLDLLQNNPSSVLLLDCRHEDEQAVSTIPGMNAYQFC